MARDTRVITLGEQPFIVHPGQRWVKLRDWLTGNHGGPVCLAYLKKSWMTSQQRQFPRAREEVFQVVLRYYLSDRQYRITISSWGTSKDCPAISDRACIVVQTHVLESWINNCQVVILTFRIGGRSKYIIMCRSCGTWYHMVMFCSCDSDSDSAGVAQLWVRSACDV